MVKANHYKISSFPDGTPLIKKDLTINYLNVISIVWTFEFHGRASHGHYDRKGRKG